MRGRTHDAMGEVFAGRYELVDPIGRGGVGAVWRAWDHRRRRYVAAKVLQQSDAHTLLRFVREQALRIDHPHVLAPASWAADDDKVLFTMDLVGRRLAGPLDRGLRPPAARFVCTLLDQLLAGLAAVHAEGVVHRDIKPANILLEATGTGRPHAAAVRLRHRDAHGRAPADRDQLRGGHARLLRARADDGRRAGLPRRPVRRRPGRPVSAGGGQAGRQGAGRALRRARHAGRARRAFPSRCGRSWPRCCSRTRRTRFRTATGARKALAAAAELLPEPGPDDELIEIFDQLGPLPTGFGPQGPARPAPPAARRPTPSRGQRNGAAPLAARHRPLNPPGPPPGLAAESATGRPPPEARRPRPSTRPALDVGHRQRQPPAAHSRGRRHPRTAHPRTPHAANAARARIPPSARPLPGRRLRSTPPPPQPADTAPCSPRSSRRPRRPGRRSRSRPSRPYSQPQGPTTAPATAAAHRHQPAHLHTPAPTPHARASRRAPVGAAPTTRLTRAYTAHAARVPTRRRAAAAGRPGSGGPDPDRRGAVLRRGRWALVAAG